MSLPIYYIQRGFDPFEMVNGKTVFHYAVEKGNAEIFKMLIDYVNEVDIANLKDANGKTCLSYALEKINDEKCLMLLVNKPGFDVSWKDDNKPWFIYQQH